MGCPFLLCCRTEQVERLWVLREAADHCWGTSAVDVLPQRRAPIMGPVTKCSTETQGERMGTLTVLSCRTSQGLGRPLQTADL